MKKILFIFCLFCLFLAPCMATEDLIIECTIYGNYDKYNYNFLVNTETKTAKALYPNGNSYTYPKRDITINNDFIKLIREQEDRKGTYEVTHIINRNTGTLTEYFSDNGDVFRGTCKKVKRAL